MIEFILNSRFTIDVATTSFYAGVHLAERHHKEKEAAVDYYVWQAHRFHDTHCVSLVPQPQPENHLMAAPAPMPPVGTGTRFDKALLPGGPIDQRLTENGQATFHFSPAKH